MEKIARCRWRTVVRSLTDVGAPGLEPCDIQRTLPGNSVFAGERLADCLGIPAYSPRAVNSHLLQLSVAHAKFQSPPLDLIAAETRYPYRKRDEITNRQQP